MVKPSNFIMNSDYATLANDDTGIATVTIPGGVSVPAGGTYIQSVDIAIGATASINRIQFSSSKDFNTRYSAIGFMGWTRIGTVLGATASYEVYAIPHRISSGFLRLDAYIPNPYGDVLIGDSGNETLTFYIDTFIPPHS